MRRFAAKKSADEAGSPFHQFRASWARLHGPVAATGVKAKLIHNKKQCKKLAKNLGKSFATPQKCAEAAARDPKCTSGLIMWPIKSALAK